MFREADTEGEKAQWTLILPTLPIVDQFADDGLGTHGRFLRSSTQASQGRYLGKVQEDRLLWMSFDARFFGAYFDGPELVSGNPTTRPWSPSPQTHVRLSMKGAVHNTHGIPLEC